MDVWAPSSLATPFVFDLGKGDSFRGPKRYKGVLHFTETPSYSMHKERYTGVSSKGNPYSTAPHFTIDLVKGPDTGIWQHVPLDRASYALVGVDRDWAIQIESCWTSDDARSFPLDRKKKLRELMIWIEAQTGITPVYRTPMAATAQEGAGPGSRFRMSKQQWLMYGGWCGHQHAPDNKHWDPGLIDADFLCDRSGPVATTRHTGTTVVSDTSITVVASEWPELLKVGAQHDKVLVVRAVLQAFGYGDLSRSDRYNENVAQAVRAFQKDERLDVDGIWGPDTHSTALSRITATMKR